MPKGPSIVKLEGPLFLFLPSLGCFFSIADLKLRLSWQKVLLFLKIFLNFVATLSINILPVRISYWVNVDLPLIRLASLMPIVGAIATMDLYATMPKKNPLHLISAADF